MHLRQIAAVGAELLPDIGNRIQADHIHPLVDEIEHVAHHLVEHDRVAVVQIPLVRIKGGHDHLPAIGQPGKVSRCCSGKNLGAGLFVLIRDRIIVKEKIAVLVGFLSCPGPARPLMLVRGVVHYKIQADVDAVFVAGVRQRRKILHRTQFRLYGPEIRHRVPAVAFSFGAGKQRHQMQIVDPAFLQVRYMFSRSLQRTAKVVGIEHHPHQIIAAVPVGVCLPFAICFFQRLAACFIKLPHRFGKFLQPLLRVRSLAIQFTVQPFQFIPTFVQPGLVTPVRCCPAAAGATLFHAFSPSTCTKWSCTAG